MRRDGFQLTLTEHGDRLYSYAVWMLGDREEARDVVQECSMRLWRQRSGVAQGAGRSWLTRTAYRLCIDRLRRRGVLRQRDLADGLDLLPSAESTGGQAAEVSEMQTGIARALARVSVRDRALIVMREMQDMSYADMADVLDMSVNTLKPALHRARERLRRELLKAGVQP